MTGYLVAIREAVDSGIGRQVLVMPHRCLRNRGSAQALPQGWPSRQPTFDLNGAAAERACDVLLGKNALINGGIGR